MKVSAKSGGACAAIVLLVAVSAVGGCQRADDQRIQVSVIALTEAFRIGDEAAGDSVLFGTVYSMAVDSKGQLYITDKGYPGIRMFSFDGALIGEIGQEGKGPGEFTRMPEVRIGPEDSLYAWDFYADRFTTFSPQDQSYVTSFTMVGSEASGLYPDDFLGATSRGFLFSYGGFYRPGSEDPSSNVEQVKLVDWNGTVVIDSVAQLPMRPGLIIATENSIRAHTLPFAVGPHFAVSADEVLYYGLDGAIHITRVPLAGMNQRKFTVPHSPVPVSDAERDELIADISDRFRGMLREQLPAVKPAFNRMMPDDANRLWIELTQPEHEQTRTWLIVDDTGLEIARADVPQNVQLRVVRNSRAYGIMTDDETGAPIVVAWNISP